MVFWILIHVNVDSALKSLKVMLSIPVPRYPAKNPDITRCILFLTFAVTQAIIRLTVLNSRIGRKNNPNANLSTDIFI